MRAESIDNMAVEMTEKTPTSLITPNIPPTDTFDVEAVEEKENKEKDTMEWKDIHATLKDWPGFGLFNIFMTHPGRTFVDFLIKVSALLLLVAQVVAPICLLFEEVKRYRRRYRRARFCPGEAPPIQRLLTIAIAIVYFSRSLILYHGKYYGYFRMSETEANPILEENLKKAPELLESRNLTILNRAFAQVDDIMNITYDGFIYMVNIFIVFITEDALNMVLNALALEFVMKLDDEFKEYYFQYNAKAVTRIKRNMPPLPKIESWECTIIIADIVAFVINSIAIFLVPTVCAFFIFYGPICKP